MSGIIGVQTTLAELNRLQGEAALRVKDAVEDATLDIETEAIRNAPSAGDKLKTTYGTQDNQIGINQFISHEFSNEGFTGKVFIDQRATKLAIYIEFGTGQDAAGYVPTLPKEFQEFARKFYVNGKGTLLKQPFLLPAYFKHAPGVVEEIKKALQGAAR